MTCRAPTSTQSCTGSSQTGAHLTYDVEGHLIQWVSADGLTTVQYGYDGEGQRFEMQVTSGGTTTTTTYLGTLEEVQAVSGGAMTTSVYFYGAGARLAEEVNGHWYYPISDHLTSTTVMVDGTGVIAAQLFGPYGQGRWEGGTMPTSYAFTGQRADGATGLDYYGARYYDPQASQFTSADTMLPGGGADPWGLSRYAYVAENPIANVDPNGHDGCNFWECVQEAANAFEYAWNCISQGWQACGTQLVNNAIQTCSAGPATCGQVATSVATNTARNIQGAGTTLANLTGVPQTVSDFQTLLDPHASASDREAAGLDLVEQVAIWWAFNFLAEVGEAALGGARGLGEVGQLDQRVFDDFVEGAACGLSFSSDTLVATPQGEEAISTLKVGDQVLAYDPQTNQTTIQTVQHLFINHDNDLMDIKLRTDDAATAPEGAKPNPATNGKIQSRAPPQGDTTSQQTSTLEETVHTTAKHPFLTAEQGWVQAGQLRPGMHVLRADGSIGVVETAKVIPGAGTRYDLEVSNVHTFEVGLGQWVVHNCTFSNLTSDEINQEIGQAGEYASSQKAVAGAIAKEDATGVELGRGINGDEISGPFAPGIQGKYNSMPGVGRCAEFYCAGNVGPYNSPINVFVYHKNRWGPCKACASTFQQWANANQASIRVFWLNKKGRIRWHVWQPM
jgi:RHS repeat-associated protein